MYLVNRVAGAGCIRPRPTHGNRHPYCYCCTAVLLYLNSRIRSTLITLHFRAEEQTLHAPVVDCYCINKTYMMLGKKWMSWFRCTRTYVPTTTCSHMQSPIGNRRTLLFLLFSLFATWLCEQRRDQYNHPTRQSMQQRKAIYVCTDVCSSAAPNRRCASLSFPTWTTIEQQNRQPLRRVAPYPFTFCKPGPSRAFPPPPPPAARR